MSVLIQSERFGDVDCEESSTLTFPHGLLGFEDQSSFVIVPVGDAFLVTAPHFFFEDYAPEVNDKDLEELDLRDESETLLLCLVTISDDDITANLLGPLVVNTRTRRARQVVLSEARWSTRVPLSGS